MNDDRLAESGKWFGAGVMESVRRDGLRFAPAWRAVRADAVNTVPEVVRDVRDRLGIARMIFVGDRGMVTTDNVKTLREAKQGYVVGLNRRRREQVYRYIESAQGPWQDCPLGQAAPEAANPDRTRVQEVPSDEPGVRIFVAHSEERLR